jgi:hypothetical protein
VKEILGRDRNNCNIMAKYCASDIEHLCFVASVILYCTLMTRDNFLAFFSIISSLHSRLKFSTEAA